MARDELRDGIPGLRGTTLELSCDVRLGAGEYGRWGAGDDVASLVCAAKRSSHCDMAKDAEMYVAIVHSFCSMMVTCLVFDTRL
jgi:hypothetical protein